MNEKRNLAAEADAKFIGWQETFTKDPIALYVVTAPNHLYFGSSVTEHTLKKLNLKIPKLYVSQAQETRPQQATTGNNGQQQAATGDTVNGE